MANLTTQTIIRDGVAPTYAAAAGGGDTYTPSDQTFLHIKNGGGGSITVTVVTTGFELNDLPRESLSVVIAAGIQKMIGPLPYEIFAESSDGLADLTYSGVTSVTVGVFRLRQP